MQVDRRDRRAEIVGDKTDPIASVDAVSVRYRELTVVQVKKAMPDSTIALNPHAVASDVYDLTVLSGHGPVQGVGASGGPNILTLMPLPEWA